MNSNNEYDFLKDLPIFLSVPKEIVVKFANAARLKSFNKGKVLYIEGDKAEYFYLIKKGWVKLFHETVGGEEAIVDILPQNYIFGETAIFDGDIYKNSAQIVENSELLIIPTSILKEQIHQSNMLALNMLSCMAKYHRRKDREIEHLSLQNTSQRIGCFLLRLIPGNQTEDITINLPYDKTLIASRLGMPLPTFSRALNTLKEATGIRIEGAKVIISNISLLHHYSCSACSSTYPCEDK